MANPVIKAHPIAFRMLMSIAALACIVWQYFQGVPIRLLMIAGVMSLAVINVILWFALRQQPSPPHGTQPAGAANSRRYHITIISLLLIFGITKLLLYFTGGIGNDWMGFSWSITALVAGVYLALRYYKNEDLGKGPP